VTGNASALVFAGTLNGSNLAYRDNKALDLNSTYTVALPDLQIAHTTVKAQTTGTFIQAAGFQISSLTAGTTFSNQTLNFDTRIAEAPAIGTGTSPRELEAAGSVIFHPDHQEIHLPSLALRAQGIEWKTPPGGQAALEYAANRIEVKDLRLVNA